VNFLKLMIDRGANVTVTPNGITLETTIKL